MIWMKIEIIVNLCLKTRFHTRHRFHQHRKGPRKIEEICGFVTKTEKMTAHRSRSIAFSFCSLSLKMHGVDNKS